MAIRAAAREHAFVGERLKFAFAAFRPAEVVFVADLPRTRNMKAMRRVARAVLLGEDPGDLSTLVNPESVQAIRAALR